jgi:hypothetical protein
MDCFGSAQFFISLFISAFIRVHLRLRKQVLCALWVLLWPKQLFSHRGHKHGFTIEIYSPSELGHDPVAP